METFWENIICWRMEGLIIYLIVANSSRFIRRLPGFGLSQESLTDLRLSWISSYNTDNNFMQAYLSISISFRMKQVPTSFTHFSSSIAFGFKQPLSAFMHTHNREDHAPKTR